MNLFVVNIFLNKGVTWNRIRVNFVFRLSWDSLVRFERNRWYSQEILIFWARLVYTINSRHEKQEVKHTGKWRRMLKIWIQTNDKEKETSNKKKIANNRTKWNKMSHNTFVAETPIESNEITFVNGFRAKKLPYRVVTIFGSISWK